MKLEVIGSGTMPLTKERVASSFLVKTEKTNLLLDAGHGTLARLGEREIDARDIDGLALSHFHTDHASDAFALVHARWVHDTYEENKAHRPLVFIGPEGTEQRFGAWREIFWPEPDEKYPIQFREGPRETAVGDLRIKAFPIKHVAWFASVGFRVTDGEKTIIYPGDVGNNHSIDDLVSQSENADLLIIEAGYPEPTPNHFTLQQIEDLADRANIGSVLLVHLKPMPEDQKRVYDFAQERESYTVATDGLSVEV